MAFVKRRLNSIVKAVAALTALCFIIACMPRKIDNSISVTENIEEPLRLSKRDGPIPAEPVGVKADKLDNSIQVGPFVNVPPFVDNKNKDIPRLPTAEKLIKTNHHDVYKEFESILNNKEGLSLEDWIIKFKNRQAEVAKAAMPKAADQIVNKIVDQQEETGVLIPPIVFEGVMEEPVTGILPDFVVINDVQGEKDDLIEGVVSAPLDDAPDYIVKPIEDVLSPPFIVNEAPGEMGKPVYLSSFLPAEIQNLVDEGWKKNSFNQYVSDIISLHRSLPDLRNPWCKEPGRILPNLPSTDLIICFHNEAWSILLRTVHSILDRSPEKLIGNIILVDDFSDMPHLKLPLEEYFKAYPKVKIVRTLKREGLIRARLLGVRHSKSPVLTFLDSHCECAEGWLEPLLDRIARNSQTVVCPVIDSINDTTLEYTYQGVSHVGGFDWNLQFNWHTTPLREHNRRHNNSAAPVYTPTMAGGMFAIDRNFFEYLGTYDPGFNIWGSENLELSFKTWMCGGTLEIIPCSHVGHLFRENFPYNIEKNVLRRNSIRLAEVWMDDYAKYYYHRIGFEKIDFGDVSGRKELRKRLGCKSFKWYLENVFPEQKTLSEFLSYGEIRNLDYGNYCLDTSVTTENIIDIAPCHKRGDKQYFTMDKDGIIEGSGQCLNYDGIDVRIYPCWGLVGNHIWTYLIDTNQIRHVAFQKCLTINPTQYKVMMEECDPVRISQKWQLENLNLSIL
ncbi:putative polypeptide N-acetylgalactosaminyltransferase 9 isoform X2 [Episyrphus balteatus]|nr:putative polypeptide N-acetylgalactosaminyltransferase 9 isoform X2 [Episyrphus balteatus]